MENRMYLLMRDEEGRKKQARSYTQQGKETQHTQGSHLEKGDMPRVGSCNLTNLKCRCTNSQSLKEFLQSVCHVHKEQSHHTES